MKRQKTVFENSFCSTPFLKKGQTMQWYPHLYMGEYVKPNIEKIKWKAEHGAGMVSVYFVTLPAGDKNLLEIMHSAVFLQPALRRQNPMIVGVAYGYTDAVDLSIQIIEDVYRETGGFQVKDYMLKEKGICCT